MRQGLLAMGQPLLVRVANQLLAKQQLFVGFFLELVGDLVERLSRLLGNAARREVPAMRRQLFQILWSPMHFQRTLAWISRFGRFAAVAANREPSGVSCRR